MYTARRPIVIAATAMLAKGAPIHEVSAVLGHSSIAITGDVYGHASTDGARAALDLLTSDSVS
jgi:integrase